MINFKGEKEIYEFWERNNFFKSDPLSKKKSYSLLVPPPNLTGELHLGHAMQHSILDAVARFKKLCGFDVLLLPGVDHAGILFEATLDKKLARENSPKKTLGREKWLKEAWKFKEEIYNSVSQTWRMVGLSADWEREVFTLDEGPQKAVFEFFKRLWDDGLIYKGPYIVQWCPKCNTAIEDVEMEYEERKEKLYYIKYFVGQHPSTGKSGSDFIEVATTRPETIFADVAIAVHPDDERYKKYRGVQANVYRPAFLEPAKSPMGGALRIVRDKRVDPKFGSGALKVTPGHDLLDYEIGKDNKLPSITVVDKNGRLNEVAGKYTGMKVMEAREAIVKELERQNLFSKQPQDYLHNVAVCERCKTVVEPLISEEWFVKMDGLAKGAIKVIKEDKINFLPKNYKKILVDWLENIHDWCISRSLWWGHRIPVWYRKKDQRSKIKDQNFKNGNIKISLESPGDGWVQDEQVLDTWFSSGIWPLSTLGWPFDFAQGKPLDKNFGLDPSLAKYFPWDLEISAPEIKYLWIGRMIMISVHLSGKIPFKTMFFHGMLRDLLGRKFSKSLGNGIEPTYLIEKWGVDATRMALYTYAIPGRDGRVSRELLDERGKNFRNFGTKIRNIAHFILELRRESGSDSVILDSIENPEKDSRIRGNDKRSKDDKKKENTSEHADDRWIKDQLETIIKKVTKHLDNIELHLAVDTLYEFVWHKFADVYIEKSKKRRVEAQPTLEYVLKNVLILLHPFMPFVTEEIYQKFGDKKKSIMLESWPSAKD